MIINDDCRNALKAFDENAFTACITDPPYDLTAVSRGGSARTNNPDSPFGRHKLQTKGFMGQQWDGTGVAFDPATWKAVLRVLKPGAFLLVFGGTRTYHRMACAIEDAGFEIRDCLMWMYGSGFPKNHNFSKALDNKLWAGWGTCLKPAYEPIIVAMKPLDGTYAQNALQHGVAGLNIDGCRIPTDENLNGGAYSSGKQDDGQWGSMHKYTGKEYQQPSGRFPANVILDEEAGQLLGDPSRFFYCPKAPSRERHCNLYWDSAGKLIDKATWETLPEKQRSKGNIHPTLKPLALMEYLVKLVNYPTGNLILDPFAGSGTTLVACDNLNLDFVGIEQCPEYVEIIKRRVT